MSTTLRDLLTRHTIAYLKDLLRHLPGVDATGRKDQLIEKIIQGMHGPGLKALWAGLNKTQQDAVAEALHDPLGEYSAPRFEAKYQCLPAFQESTAKAIGYADRFDRKSTALGLFIQHAPDLGRDIVPLDLQAALKTFVPQPAPLRLKSSEALADEEGLAIRLSEREALQEVAIMLRTLERTRIQVSEKTSLPGSATLRLLSEKLAGGDFYPWGEKKNSWNEEIGPIRAFAWPMLLQAGGLANRTASRLALGPAGIKALRTAPADVLHGLWRKWQKSTLLDEFSRIDAIKGQTADGKVMTAVAPRRAVIEKALQECPVGRWVAFDAFSRFMRASNLLFSVAQDAWKLYIGERHYGNLGYDGSSGWNILQDRYMAALLFEYAATLGIVDVAYRNPVGASQNYQDLWGADDLDFLSRYDGLRFFRLTQLGAYILGLDPTYRPLAIQSNVALLVMPSLLVNVVRGALVTEEVLLLETWAVPVQDGSWRLDRQKALAAIEQGHDIAQLRSFLESRDDMPLPEPVDAFIKQCERNGKALQTVGNALLLECRDQETAELITAHKETGALCLRAGPKMLVVRSEHLEKFRERVRLLGFGLAG